MSGKTVMANAMLSSRLSGPLIDEGDSGSGRFLSMKGNMGGRNLPRNHGRLMGITNNWTMLCIAAQSYSGTAMSGNTVTANAMLSNRLSGPLIDEGDSGSGRFLSMKGNMGRQKSSKEPWQADGHN